MEKDAIGNRMKDNYENRSRFYLTRRTPVIMRLDGKDFHTLTKKLTKPFDRDFSTLMNMTAYKLLEEIQGAKCSYVQSDEISILITDFDRLTTDSWFDYNIQKMTSVSSGIASAYFSKIFITNPYLFDIITFDSRVFNIPKEEVCNYFIWRQLDWIRNSVQMLSQSVFSHKELHKKNQTDMHEMLHTKGINWSKLDNIWKNGAFLQKSDNELVISHDIIFKEDRTVIEKYLIGE